MKVSLERVDAHGIVVTLPGGESAPLTIRDAVGLRGELEQGGDRLALSGVVAEQLAVVAAQIDLDGLVLASKTGLTLDALTLSLEQRADHLALDVAADSVTTLDLEIAVEDVRVSARATLLGARLSLRDAEGSLDVDRIELLGFALRIGEVAVAADSLSGVSVQFRWGAAGFALAARMIDGTSGTVDVDGTRVAVVGARVLALALDPHRISVERLDVEQGNVEHTLEKVSAAAGGAANDANDANDSSDASDAGGEPLIELRTLDRLDGEIDVDVDLDVTVPIIGHRHATHHLRVPVVRGTVDYRALERNLAPLEDALLDFSVRDHALVVERVNPLFPARGHGKPLVEWALDDEGVALAEQQRVRLAVLPTAKLLAEPDEPSHAAKRSIAIRTLAFRSINTRVSLAPLDETAAAPALPISGQLRLARVDMLAFEGTVAHAPGESPPDGAVRGELLGLVASIVDLPLGTSRLDVANVALKSAGPIAITFRDLHPATAQLELKGLTLTGAAVRLGPSAHEPATIVTPP